MFGKDKVKGHNRIIKGKSGFKVTRISDFLRKKDDSRKRNIAIGSAAVIGAGGIALLLRKKGIKFPGNMVKENNLVKATEKVITPKNTINKEVTSVVKTPKIEKDIIPDPWETPVETKINTSNEMLVKPNVKDIPLLTGKKIPGKRDNLLVTDDRVSKRVTSSVVRLNEMDKTYKSISPDNLAMRASIKIDHYLKRPRKTSNLGAPPKPTSLEEVIKNPNIKQAQKKVEDRLARAERQVNKKTKTLKKN